MSQKFEDMTEVITQYNENRRIEKDTIQIHKSPKDYTYVKTNCLAAVGWVGLEFDYVDQIKNLIEEVTQDYNKRVIYYLESALSRLSQLKFCSLPIRGELEECIASVHEQNKSLKEYVLQLEDYVRLVNETEDSIVEQFSKIGCDYVNGVPVPIYEVDPTKDVIVINGITFPIEVDASDIKQGNDSVHTISGFIEDYWNKDNGYFEGFWWQDEQKLKEAIAVLRLEIQENGPIQINKLDYSDEVNYRYMIVIQALANALRTGTYDEGTLTAIENSLVTVGREFKNHSLDEECLDLLVKRYSKIIGKETGDWLEQGWGDVLAGLGLLALGYVTTKFGEMPVVESEVKKGTKGGFKSGTLSNVEARKWYLENEAKIPNMIDKSLPLKQQAKQAFDLRNQFRTQARELMSDRTLAKSLSKSDPNKTWKEMIQRQIDKGLTGDDIYKGIIKSSQKSRPSVNKSLGLD